MNIKKLEKNWVYDKEVFSLSDGGFTIGERYSITPKGRVDYEDFKHYTVAASGQPLYIKREGSDNWELVKTREQVQIILDNVPAVLYPEI
jgi:hypothetical protein